ncbi:MAG: hypothetical protein ABIB43_05980 [archaeon]
MANKKEVNHSSHGVFWIAIILLFGLVVFMGVSDFNTGVENMNTYVPTALGGEIIDIPPTQSFYVNIDQVTYIDETCDEIAPLSLDRIDRETRLYQTCKAMCFEADFERFTGSKFCTTEDELVCICA